MNPTTLADPAAAPATGQPAAGNALAGNGADPDGSSGGPQDATSAAPARTCANCGAQLGPEQDWCLECGEGAPGSLEAGGPGWRSATAVLAATGLLVLAAAGAGYAALSKTSHKPTQKVVALVEQPAATAGTPSTPAATTPAAPAPSTPAPLGATTPPRIPLSTPTPNASTVTPPSSTGSGSNGTSSAGLGLGLGSTGSSKTTKSPSKSSTGKTSTEPESSEPEPPTPILLDTNAASTYNPYGYPVSEFGDPRLAIDGETATAWTARVNPAVAPKMAVGLVVNFKSSQKVASLTLITSTPGMTVQVYGSSGNSLPGSITDPAWTALSSAQVASKHTTQIKLREASKAFHYIVLWINNAPASEVGTAKAPGHVSVNEVELFPAK